MLPPTVADDDKIWAGVVVNKSQTVVHEMPTLTVATVALPLGEPHRPPREYTATGDRIIPEHDDAPIWPLGRIGGNGGGSGNGPPDGSSHGSGSGGRRSEDVPPDIPPSPYVTETSSSEETHGPRGWRPTIRIDSPAEYNGKDGPSTVP